MFTLLESNGFLWNNKTSQLFPVLEPFWTLGSMVEGRVRMELLKKHTHTHTHFNKWTCQEVASVLRSLRGAEGDRLPSVSCEPVCGSDELPHLLYVHPSIPELCSLVLCPGHSGIIIVIINYYLPAPALKTFWKKLGRCPSRLRREWCHWVGL